MKPVFESLRRWTRDGVCPIIPPVAPIFSGLFSQVLYKPVLGPVIRVLSGLVAIPLFRFLLRRVLRVQTHDAELERDLEFWFRGAILLLAATANLEDFLFGWTQWHQNAEPWLTMLARLLLAIGVIECMPDQDLFALVHRKFPKWGWKRRQFPLRESLHAAAVLHLKRSSPVLVIMCVVFGGPAGTLDFQVGWWCYGLALLQYLIIALSTDRRRAIALLAALDPEQVPVMAERMRFAAGDGGAFAEPDADFPPQGRSQERELQQQ